MKRSCCCLLPACFKSKAARRGIELSQLTIIQTIALPLVLVAVDVGSDGNMLSNMVSIMNTLAATNTTINKLNSTDDNVTEQLNSSSTEEIENRQGEGPLGALFGMSCAILFFSMLNLMYSKPAKTLIRNARTSVLMSSRELESKDVPVPIGESFSFVII